MQPTQKAHRLNDLIYRLETSERSLSLSFLSKELNCNEKTIRRYISELSDYRMAPYSIKNSKVDIDHTARQEKTLINGYWLDKSHIDNLLQTYNLVNKLPKELAKLPHKKLKNTLKTLGANPKDAHVLAPHIEIIPSLPVKINQEIFQVLADALLEGKKATINHWNREQNTHTKRTISPQKLVFYKDQWYVDAYCHLSKAIRTFNLIAIDQANLLEKNANKISKKELKAHFEQSYGIFSGKDTAIAIIKFSPKMARWVSYCQWHSNQKIIKQEDDSIHLHIPYNNPTELVADILKWGEEAIILSPPQLQQYAKQKIAQMYKNYQSLLIEETIVSAN